ncbi:MAG: hypothetical protein WC897_05750 [Candidatus Gracilibacteria bacterium]
MAELPSNYEVAKNQLASLANKKLATGKWLDEKTLKSTPEAKILAEEVKREYESITGSYKAVREGLFNDVLSPLAKRKDFYLGKGVSIGEDDKYNKKGILFAIEENCMPLEEAFTKVPALRNLAYASIFNQMSGAGYDANYLPKDAQITMTDGCISLSYPDGIDLKTIGPFDLFPWPKGEELVKDDAGSDEQPAKPAKEIRPTTVETAPDLTREDAERLFPAELKDILYKENAEDVWHPAFVHPDKDAVKIKVGKVSYTFQKNTPPDGKNLALLCEGELGDSEIDEIFGPTGWKSLNKDADKENVRVAALKVFAFEIAKKHITDSIELGREQYGAKWTYEYKAELKYLDSAIALAETVLSQLKDKRLEEVSDEHFHDKNAYDSESQNATIDAMAKAVADGVAERQKEGPAKTTDPAEMSERDGRLQGAVIAPLLDGDVDTAYYNVGRLAQANSAVGSTETSTGYYPENEKLIEMSKNYGRLSKMNVQGLKELTVVKFGPSTGASDAEYPFEYQKVFDAFLNKYINEKVIFGKAKPKESIYLEDKLLPVGQYKAVFENGKETVITIGPLFGTKKEEKGATIDFDGRTNEPAKRSPVVEKTFEKQEKVAKKQKMLPKGFEKSKYLQFEEEGVTKYKLDLTIPFAPNDKFTATIKYRGDGTPEGVDFGRTKPISDAEFMDDEAYTKYRDELFKNAMGEPVDVEGMDSKDNLLMLARRDYYLRETIKSLKMAQYIAQGNPTDGLAYGLRATYDYKMEIKFLREEIDKTETKIKDLLAEPSNP